MVYQFHDIEVGDEIEHEFKCPDCDSEGITCYTILVSGRIEKPDDHDEVYSSGLGEFTGSCTSCNQAELFDLIQITSIQGKGSSRAGDGLW